MISGFDVIPYIMPGVLEHLSHAELLVAIEVCERALRWRVNEQYKSRVFIRQVEGEVQFRVVQIGAGPVWVGETIFADFSE